MSDSSAADNGSAISRKSQRYLGEKGLVVFLTLLETFVALSTDMYLPALPPMAKYFGAPMSQVNLTLALFFVFFAAGTLIWGPLSDKYGRRPIVLSGMAIYTVASILCAVSTDISQLVVLRVVQALGAGAGSAVGMAIVSDAFEGKAREKILALVQAMFVFAPALSPIIGAFLLERTSWRGIFVALSIVGIVCLVGALAYEETATVRDDGGVLQSLGRLGVVLRNPHFSALLVIFSLPLFATMAFISSSSYIYQDDFGLSSQTYSFFFLFNALGMLVGPLLYVKLSARFARFKIVSACFAVMALGGLLVVLLGGLSPFVFAPCLVVATIAAVAIRPPASVLMLDQAQGDAGSASSLMNAGMWAVGSAGIVVASLSLGSLVHVIGIINIAIGVVCGGLWLAFSARPLLGYVREEA